MFKDLKIMKTNIITINTIMNNIINRANMAKKKYMKYICAVLLLIGTSAHAWATANIAEGRYELVTDLSTLTAGDKYILAGTASNELYAAKPFANSSADKLTVYDLGSWTTTAPTSYYDINRDWGICEFTLGGSSGQWTFNDGNYTVYVNSDGKLVTTSSSTCSAWEIDMSSNSRLTIKSQKCGNSDWTKTYMAYNGSGTGQFRAYTSSGAAMYMFKYVPSVTLHEGVGGESTSSIAIGAYFPNDAEEVPGWAFIGYWATSAHSDEAPDYPSGSVYNSSNQAAAGTYYAIYQGIAYGCNYGDYSCKPAAIYTVSSDFVNRGNDYDELDLAPGCGEEGTTIVLTAIIREAGHAIQAWTVTRDDNGQSVTGVYDEEESTYTFTLPASDVTVNVTLTCPDISGETVTIPTITPVYNTSTSKWEATAAWNAVDGATNYNVRFGDITTTTVLTSPDPTVVTTTSYTNDAVLKNLTEGDEYRLRVQAYNACDPSHPTVYAQMDFEVTCADLEGTLAISLDEVSSTTANLSWGGATTPAIQTTAGANSSLKYDVKVTRILPLPAEADGGTLNVSNVTYTAWEGTGLTTGATYRIDVTAKNACGETMAASRTFKCKAYEDYLFTCADLSLTDEEVAVSKTPIWITTSAGQLVRSQKALHIEGSGLAPGAAFTFTIGGVAANDCSGTGAHDLFAIRNANYSAVTADPSGAIDADVYVFYNPTATSDGLDQPGSTIVATSAAGKVGDVEYKSMSATLSTTSVNGRHLPSQFVMAARIGKTWYALPGNLTTNATQDPIMIGVNNSTNPTIAYCPATYGFKIVGLASTEAVPSGNTANNAVDGRGFYTDGEKIKLRLQNDAPMFGSTGTSIGKSEATNWWGGGKNYFWTLEHQNTAASNINAVTYNIRTANTNSNPLIRLNRGQWKWGLYANGVEEIRLLSITPVGELTMEVMEWGTNEIAVKYTGGGSLTKVQIGEAEEGEATLSTICGDIKRISGLSSLVAGAGGKQCQQMLIQITESEVLKQKIVQVPFIVNTTDVTTDNLRTWTDGGSTAEQDSITYNMEIVVRPGAKLTTNSGAGKFGALSIYPGGVADISNNIRLAHFNMRGGYSWLGGAFAMPHAKVTGNVTGNSNTVVFDYYMDKSKYYDLALPKTMTWVPVTDETGNDSFNYWVKQYNGATRASTGKGWTWYDWSGEASSWKINMGQGYLVAAQPPTGRNYFIMRFPMPMTLASDEASKDPIAVTAYGMTDGKLDDGVSANNAGWNFIANPFLTSYKKDADGVDAEGDAISGSIATGALVPEEKDGKPTGKYEWEEGSSVRYVTTYNYGTGEYTQHRMSETELEPFTGFFIQVAKDCYVKFDASGRQNNIVIRRANANLPADMEVGITASIEEESDETIILLCDDLSRENGLEFPDETSKMINAGKVNFYTFAGNGDKMYANGMSYAEGQEWNAAGLIAVKDGEYTFGASKVNTNYVKAVLLRDGYDNTEYDLLNGDVTIYVEKGTEDSRFAVKVVLKDASETTTVLDELNEEGINRGPEKFIYNDVMYIRYNGRIYDAMGRKVKEINK